jgi:hypothetical protein
LSATFSSEPVPIGNYESNAVEFDGDEEEPNLTAVVVQNAGWGQMFHDEGPAVRTTGMAWPRECKGHDEQEDRY